MPTFIITTPRYEKPLPALPYYEGHSKRTSIVIQADDCSVYSYASSVSPGQDYSHSRRHKRDSQTSTGTSQHWSIPSILKYHSTENEIGRRKTHKKTVRFMPIIDNLLRHALHSRCIAHDLRFPPHSARIPSPMDHNVLGGLGSGHYMPFCKKTRVQPAASPPAARIWIISYEFPWVIEVNGTGVSNESHRFTTSSRSKDNSVESFVTIYDVLHTLWANLQEPMVESEWSSLSSSRRRSIRRTCIAAYAHEPSRSLPPGSTSRSRSHKTVSDTRRIVRRVDWLGTSTRFGGLRKDEALIAERVEDTWRRELTWVLVLGNNEYRYEDISSGD